MLGSMVLSFTRLECFEMSFLYLISHLCFLICKVMSLSFSASSSSTFPSISDYHFCASLMFLVTDIISFPML